MTDLEILPDGDLTEVSINHCPRTSMYYGVDNEDRGERDQPIGRQVTTSKVAHTNSTGQKQRVNIARALYFNADINVSYILNPVLNIQALRRSSQRC